MAKHVVVVGAGIVGVSTGLWLRRLGHEVTLVDPKDPGQGTSFGNAGVLASCAVVPVTTPGLIAKAPRMVFDRDFPLFLRWPYLPKLAPWLLAFVKNANDADTRRITSGVSALISDSVEQHLAVTDGLSARSFVEQSDYVFAYPDKAAFDKESYEWALRRDQGFEPDLITGPAVQEYDPAFGPDISCLAVMRDHGFISDPGGYVAALADDLRSAGGRILKAEVTDITTSDSAPPLISTNEGPIACDSVVLAAGVWSKPLMKKLGLNIPLETERGYHIVFKNASGGPKVPSMISSGKFVATPMRNGLRCAGIVELGGLEAGPSDAPFALLRRHVSKALPHLEFEEEETWMGHRPTLTDSLPMIGEIGRSNVFTAFGHQHIGLTGGPKTGRLIAGLVSGQPSNLDLSPYSPMRFSR